MLTIAQKPGLVVRSVSDPAGQHRDFYHRSGWPSLRRGTNRTGGHLMLRALGQLHRSRLSRCPIESSWHPEGSPRISTHALPSASMMRFFRRVNLADSSLDIGPLICLRNPFMQRPAKSFNLLWRRDCQRVR